MSDSQLESDYGESASPDFAPVKPAKTKPKAAAPKKTAAAGKSRGRPPKDPSAPPKPKAKPKAAPKKRKADSDDENSDIHMKDALDDDDESHLIDTPPKAKKGPALKKSSGKPLANISNESFDMMDGIEDGVPETSKTSGGSSSKYQMVCTLASIEY